MTFTSDAMRAGFEDHKDDVDSLHVPDDPQWPLPKRRQPVLPGIGGRAYRLGDSVELGLTSGDNLSMLKRTVSYPVCAAIPSLKPTSGLNRSAGVRVEV